MAVAHGYVVVHLNLDLLDEQDDEAILIRSKGQWRNLPSVSSCCWQETSFVGSGPEPNKVRATFDSVSEK